MHIDNTCDVLSRRVRILERKILSLENRQAQNRDLNCLVGRTLPRCCDALGKGDLALLGNRSWGRESRKGTARERGCASVVVRRAGGACEVMPDRF
jgi:hypothetical protein